jgi:uncharacterized protein YndB with AHSA1/START domain
MENLTEKTSITVKSTVQAPVEKVWALWTEPMHIMKWNHASDDWHTTHAENDLRTGGTFTSRMEAKDGSVGFDFAGTYTAVQEHERIEYAMEDGRKVQISFVQQGADTHVTETFDAEQTHSADMQRQGWQAILDNFKRYVEKSGNMETLH